MSQMRQRTLNRKERALNEFRTGIFFWAWKMLVLDSDKSGYMKKVILK